jgi:transcriptional regulator with XRE-family HTH domain
VSAQLHALRLRRGWTQAKFAQEADMKQSRVSAMEQPGAVNFNLETLVRSAAAHGVGLAVKFVPFSEMLTWENGFNQDTFDPVQIDQDLAFLSPSQTWPARASVYFGSIGLTQDQFITTTAPIPGQHPILEGQIVSHYEQNPPIAERTWLWTKE